MIKDVKELEKILSTSGSDTYQLAKLLAGKYAYDEFELTIDTVPEDLSIHPIQLRVRVSQEKADFPKFTLSTRGREIALRDFLTRNFGKQAARNSMKVVGGKGGKITIDRPARYILETSAVVVSEDLIEARFTVELPFERGRYSGIRAVELFLKRIPKVVRRSLFYSFLDSDSLAKWLETVEDADTARGMLEKQGLVAFVADGSVLCGRDMNVEDQSDDIVKFKSPDELAVSFDLPNNGPVRGMGIPKGITVVLGGKSNGKTALIDSITNGVYNRIPGDGREFVVALPDAVGIRSDEGRRAKRVDISPLLAQATKRPDPDFFTSESAGALESQAANIIEALEIGTSLFLFDEDTTAAGMLGRDARTQMLIPANDEPSKTLVDVLPSLREGNNISSIIALSGFGDFIDCADTVIAMTKFVPASITEKAKKLTAEKPSGRKSEIDGALKLPKKRCPIRHTLEPYKTKNPDKERPRGIGYVQYGDEFVDLIHITQLVSISQARGIARAMALVYRLMDGANSLTEAVDHVMKRVNTVGLDTLSNRCMGDLSSFRAHELAAAVNRLKMLKIM